MTTKTIFWDNDGVLVDTERLYFRATQQVLATVGIPLTDEQYRELFLIQGKGAWHLAAAHGLSPTRIDDLRTARNALYAESLASGSLLLDGVTAVLEELHGSYLMGVVTSSRKDHFDIIHQTTGLLKYFDFVITADDCVHVKPNPELYIRAIARSGHEPGACLAIEDSERGLAAAVGAGIRCVIVPTVLTSGGTFSGASQVINHITDLPDLLRGSSQ